MSVEQADRWDPVLRQGGRFIRSSSFSQMFEDLLDHLPVFDAALRRIGDDFQGAAAFITGFDQAAFGFTVLSVVSAGSQISDLIWTIKVNGLLLLEPTQGEESHG